MHFEIITVFFIYFIIVFAIGFYASRRINNETDFILGGRHLKGAIAALGVGASDMSGWLLLGLPGAVFLHGINQIWIPIGLSIGAFANWHIIAARLRVYTEIAGDSLTIPAFIDNRFGDTNGLLRILSGIIILYFYTIYTSAGFVGGALLFESFFPFDYNQALIIGAAIIALYTCIGGFLAVNWVDFFQGCLMFIALIIVPIAAFFHIGSWDEVFMRIQQINPNMNNAFAEMSLLSILSMMAWGLGYMGQPHILSRFMAVTTVDEIPKARFICMTWMIISLYGALFTGFMGIAYFNGQPLPKPEQVFIKLSLLFFNPWIVGCILAAVLSAIMSTIAAQLLASSSSLVEDFYRRFFRKNAGDTELVWINRIMVILIAAVALSISLNPNSYILELVSYGWAGLGATFGPVMLYALFSEKTNSFGVACGMITGTITVIVWDLCKPYGGIFAIYNLLPGFIMGCFAIYLGSIFSKSVNPRIRERHRYFKEILYQKKPFNYG